MTISRIDTTLREIGEAYRSGLIGWIKRERPPEWARMLKLEEQINGTALGSDEVGLQDALDAYRAFFGEMTMKFKEAQRRCLYSGV